MLQLSCFTAQLFAQNHAPNPGFEDKYSCPTRMDQLTYCKSWYNFTKYGTPDYYDTCGKIIGPQVPINGYGDQEAIGGAYVGIYANYGYKIHSAEYIATEIVPLEKDSFYEVSMSVSLADTSDYAVSGFGMLFYKNWVDIYKPAGVLPRVNQVDYTRYGPIADMNNWVRLKGYLLADSAYDHVVIGIMKDTGDIVIEYLPPRRHISRFSYYYMDSIVIKKTKNIVIEYADSLLCTGDTINIGCFVNPIIFQQDNMYTVELSDKNGDFNSPVIIGSLLGNQSDTISAIIPANTPQGNHYRIRVVADKPGTVSDDNGIDIQIGSIKPVISTSANTPICDSDTLRISATSSVNNVVWHYWRRFMPVLKTTVNTYTEVVPIRDSGMRFIMAVKDGCPSKIDTINAVIMRYMVSGVNLDALPGTTAPKGTEIIFKAIKKNQLDSIATFQWYKNGVQIPNATDSIYKALLGSDVLYGDSICVAFTPSYLCPKNPILYNCFDPVDYLSIVSEGYKKNHRIYPNPTSGLFSIANLPINSTIQIFDITGRVVFQDVSSKEAHNHIVNINNFKNGVYLLKLTDDKGHNLYKLIKN